MVEAPPAGSKGDGTEGARAPGCGKEDKRELFEGREDYEVMRMRLRKRVEARTAPKECERFLKLMRDRGGGNIALAWRRYFDSDGDGELSFREFCEALIELKYMGDVPALWNELGGSESNALTLEALDPENAAVLDFFGDWCGETKGGPLEVFKEIDEDGSDSLTADELAEGLRRLGFFSVKGLPPSLSTEEQVLANLFPLLDQNGHGCITPGALLFLEKDPPKKQQLARQLARIAAHGAEAAPEPLHNDAQRMLHKLCMQTTMLGGRHWKLLKPGLAVGDPSTMKRSVSAGALAGGGPRPSRGSSSTTALGKHGAPPCSKGIGGFAGKLTQAHGSELPEIPRAAGAGGGHGVVSKTSAIQPLPAL